MNSEVRIERAVLETLIYSDIFNYPLRLDELQRYLPVYLNGHDLHAALAQLDGRIGKRDGYYFVAGRQDIVRTRQSRELPSRRALRHAHFYGRILNVLPFIRMVAVTGSLAVLNCEETADLDFMLVTRAERVWTARAAAVVLGRLARLFGDTLCPNLIISERALEWPLHDMYSAREFCQMVLVAGQDVHTRLIAANAWVDSLLPNARRESKAAPGSKLSSILQKILEFPLRGRLGDRLEAWEMHRKVARFALQSGYGVETVFNAEVCQGNFHHHRTWTAELFENRLSQLEIESPVRAAEPQGEGA
jgi:hypothetical protein